MRTPLFGMILPYVPLAMGATLSLLSLMLIEKFPNGIFEDDVYFYFQIARNILETGRSTFDGIETTNGYHPLWMGILVLAGLPAKLLDAHNSLLFAFCFVLVSCATWALSLAYLRKEAMLLGAVLGLYCGLGMETPLASFLLIKVFDRVLKNESALVWVYLMVATRIDLVVAVLPLWFVVDRKEGRRLVAAALLAGFTVGAFNLALTGFPYSISAYIKARTMSRNPLSTLVNNFRGWGGLYRYSVLVLANSMIFYRVKRLARMWTPHEARTTWLLLTSANAFVVFHTLVSGIRDWHFAPSLLSLLYLWSRLELRSISMEDKSPTDPWLRWGMLAAAGAGIVLFCAYVALRSDDMKYSREFIADVRKAVPTGSTIYALDGAGYLGWMLHGHPRVIDGDGLVNSFEYYQSTYLPCELDAYFRQHSIDYYVKTSLGTPNCPTGCYCLPSGQSELLAASQSTRNFLAYRLYRVTR